jgi:hypothetical protein
MQLEEILGFVKQLSLVDKVRLIERVAPKIEQDLTTTQKNKGSRCGLSALAWEMLHRRLRLTGLGRKNGKIFLEINAGSYLDD